MTVEIPLTQGRVALVDDEDYAYLINRNWMISSNGYAVRYDKKQKIAYMHRDILHLASGDKRQADHISGDKLDNRRTNLRVVTQSQNAQNRNKYSCRGKTSSIFKGVYWDKQKKKWRAHITVMRKMIALGRFSDEVEAAKAYDAAARIYFGELAKTNF